MPEMNKIEIALVLQLKELTKGLKTADSAIKTFAKSVETSGGKLAKAYDALNETLSDIGDTYNKLSGQAASAGKAQAKAAKDAKAEQEKLNEAIKKTHNTLKSTTERFMRGFGKGSGLGGLSGMFSGDNKAGRFGGALGRGLTGGLSAIAGFTLGGIQQAYGTYIQYGMARAGMAGLGLAGKGSGLGRANRGMGRLGFGPTETAMLTPGAMAATGAAGGLLSAGRLAMAGGFGHGRIGEAIGVTGAMAQAGYGFDKKDQKSNEKELSKAIAAGQLSGLKQARLPEFFQGLTSLMQQQFSTTAGKVNMGGLARQMAFLGSTKQPGFQGARGAAVMGQLNQMITAPGAGMAGQALVLQAMGFGKPEGGTSYYDALKMQQKGVRDEKNVQRIFSETNKQFGVAGAGGSPKAQQEANIVLSELSGFSLETVEKLQDLYNSDKTEAQKSKIANDILKDNKSLAEKSYDVSKEGFLGIKKHFNKVEGLQIAMGSKWAPTMLKFQNYQLEALGLISDYLLDSIRALTIGFGWMSKRDPKKAIEDMNKGMADTVDKSKKKKLKTFGSLSAENKRLLDETTKNLDKVVVTGFEANTPEKGLVGTGKGIANLLGKMPSAEDIKRQGLKAAALKVYAKRRVETEEAFKTQFKRLGYKTDEIPLGMHERLNEALVAVSDVSSQAERVGEAQGIAENLASRMPKEAQKRAASRRVAAEARRLTEINKMIKRPVNAKNVNFVPQEESSQPTSDLPGGEKSIDSTQ